jgi:hypothetical protein
LDTHVLCANTNGDFQKTKLKNELLMDEAHKGPYFNGLNRKGEAPSASSFVGGSMAMSLFYWRKNDSCAQCKSKKGLV